ncbi:MAG: hypothetical protein AMXMBFR78_28820 [Rubrivivax sp.]
MAQLLAQGPGQSLGAGHGDYDASMSDAPVLAPPAVRRARAGVVAALLALVVLGLAWELVLAPTGRGSWALKVLPLLLLLPDLLRHRLYTYRAASLLVWLYLTEGLVRATSEGGRAQALAAAEVVLALLLFVLCLHYILLRLPRRRKNDATKLAPIPDHET